MSELFSLPQEGYLEEIGIETHSDERQEAIVPRRGRTTFKSTPTKKSLFTLKHSLSTSSRFFALFDTALTTRIPQRESARFLDRFRYVICTSQLLAETAQQSQYQRSIRRSGQEGDAFKYGFSSFGEDQAFWDAKKAAKVWMGSGGCVVLVSLLMTWALKSSNSRLTQKVRATAALTLALVVALFLYGAGRRAYTRHLHLKAATLVEALVGHCQQYDAVALKVISLIQEVELVSRGYRLTVGAVLPPVARIEANARQRRCRALRAATSSSLNLIFTATCRACAVVEPLASKKDFNKLSDVYNIVHGEDQDDLAFLCEENDSLAYLKALFHQMHSRRRRFLCCLLVVQADGRSSNAKVWRAISGQLQTLSDLMSSLECQMRETLDDDSSTLDVTQFTQLTDFVLTPGQREIEERKRHQARGINNLSHTLRRTQAKMYILREESGRILQQSKPTLDQNGTSEILEHYDSLGQDLHTLLAEWEEGRALLAKASCPDEVPDQGPFENINDEIEPIHASFRDSLGFWGPRLSISNLAALATPSTVSESLSCETEQVYEGDSIDMSNTAKSGMSRADRISAMRIERDIKQARSAQRRLEAQAKSTMVGELKDVLGSRVRERERRPLVDLDPSQRTTFNASSTMPSRIKYGDRLASFQSTSASVDSGFESIMSP